MAGYNLGEARGKIVLETDFKSLAEAQSQLDTIKSQAGKTTSEMMGSKEAFDNVAKGAGLAGAGIAAGFAVAVKTASDFEFQMSAIQAVSGATTGEMDSIREAALRIGKDTAYSASEAAQAMEELLKAGISVDDVMNGAADATVALAAAGGVDLPTAATIASNAMNQFGLAAEDLVSVTDTIAGAANASAIDMTDFAMSMSQVGAVANLAGASFDDTSTAIALMGNAGIKGSDAGTSLKTMLMNLQPSTAAAAEEMKRLGLITEDGTNQFYDANGSLKSLSDVSGILQGSLEGMTDAQKQAALQTLFGSDAIRGAAVLADQGAAGFDKMTESIGKVSAADVAATRLDNMKGSMEALQGSVETVAIQVGEKLVPFLTDLFNNVGTLIDTFGSLDSGMQTAIVTVAGVAGGLLLAVAATIKTVQAIQAAAATYRALAAAIGGIKALQAGYAAATYGAAGATYAQTAAGKLGAAVFKAQQVALKVATAAQWLFNAAVSANPIGIIIIAILAVVAALVYFFTQTETGKAAWSSFMQFLSEAWANIVSVATTVFGALGDFFSSVWDGIVSFATAAFEVLKNIFFNFTPLGIIISNIGPIVGFFQTVFEGAKSIIEGAINGIVAIFQFFAGVAATVFNAIVTFITPFAQWFQTYMVPLITAAVGLVVAIVQYLWSAVVLAFTTAFNLLVTILTAIASFFTAVWNNIVSFVTTVVSAIVAFISAYFAMIYTIVSAVLNTVIGVVTDIWNSILKFIQNVVSNVVSFVRSVWNTLVGIVTGVLNSVLNTVTNIWNSVVNFIRQAVTNAVNTVRSVFSSVVGVVSSAFSGVVSAVSGPFNQVLSFIQGIQAKIQGVFSGAGAWLLSAGKNIIQGLINGIEGMISALTSKLSFITNLIPESKGPERVDKVLLQDNGEMIMQSLINGIANKTGDLTGQLGDITTLIPASVGGNPGAGGPVGGGGNTYNVDRRQTFNIHTDENPTLWARAVGREYDNSDIGAGR
jgi:TP901 family phage tail tape measure protein